MMHQQIREARVRAGLTQVKLAELADVPRSQLRKFEEGGNITVSTLRKIVAQLPELRSLSLGAVEIAAGGIDPVAVREAATELMAAAQRLLTALGTPAPEAVAPVPEKAAPEAPAPAAAAPGKDRGHWLERDGTMYKPPPGYVSPELARKLKRLEAVVEAYQNREKAKDHS